MLIAKSGKANANYIIIAHFSGRYLRSTRILYMVILFNYYQAGSIKRTKSPEEQRVGYETTMHPYYSLRILTNQNMALVMRPGNIVHFKRIQIDAISMT